MPKSLTDPEVQAAFDRAAAGRPFASPQDWRNVWIYFLMVDRFNRDDGRKPANLPYDAPFGGYQGGTFNGSATSSGTSRTLAPGRSGSRRCSRTARPTPARSTATASRTSSAPSPGSPRPPARRRTNCGRLVDEAHALGLYVIFDIVLNHAGDVFGYKGQGPDGGLVVDGPADRVARRDGRPADLPAIEDVPAALRQPDGLIWPEQLQQNRYFRRKGKGGEDGRRLRVAQGVRHRRRRGRRLPGPQRPDPGLSIRHRPLRRRRLPHRHAEVHQAGLRPDVRQRDARVSRSSIGKKNFFTFGEVFDDEERIAQFIGRNTADAGDIVGRRRRARLPSVLPPAARRQGVRAARRT